MQNLQSLSIEELQKIAASGDPTAAKAASDELSRRTGSATVPTPPSGPPAIAPAPVPETIQPTVTTATKPETAPVNTGGMTNSMTDPSTAPKPDVGTPPPMTKDGKPNWLKGFLINLGKAAAAGGAGAAIGGMIAGGRGALAGAEGGVRGLNTAMKENEDRNLKEKALEDDRTIKVAAAGRSAADSRRTTIKEALELAGKGEDPGPVLKAGGIDDPEVLSAVQAARGRYAAAATKKAKDKILEDISSRRKAYSDTYQVEEMVTDERGNPSGTRVRAKAEEELTPDEKDARAVARIKAAGGTPMAAPGGKGWLRNDKNEIQFTAKKEDEKENKGPRVKKSTIIKNGKKVEVWVDAKDETRIVKEGEVVPDEENWHADPITGARTNNRGDIVSKEEWDKDHPPKISPSKKENLDVQQGEGTPGSDKTVSPQELETTIRASQDIPGETPDQKRTRVIKSLTSKGYTILK